MALVTIALPDEAGEVSTQTAQADSDAFDLVWKPRGYGIVGADGDWETPPDRDAMQARAREVDVPSLTKAVGA